MKRREEKRIARQTSLKQAPEKVSERERERETDLPKMASFLQSFIDPRKNWLAKQHMKTLSSRLRRYGLFLFCSFFQNPNYFLFSHLYFIEIDLIRAPIR
jgi:hypothetical protein